MEQEAAPLRDDFAALCEACVNCETLTEAAADVVEDPEFRRRLNDRRDAWAQVTRNCAALLHESGGALEENPTIGPTLQRAWVKIKAAVNDEKGIVKECLRREEMVRERLEATLRRDLTPPVRAKLRAVLDRVASLNLPP